jgi:hypothetical protein
MLFVVDDTNFFPPQNVKSTDLPVILDNDEGLFSSFQKLQQH